MTRDSRDRRQRMAELLEQAFDSGALVFSEPLLDALTGASKESEELPGHVRSEHGVDYEIERKLGRGGMATVYLARDPKHDRLIAIKVLHNELTARVGGERFVWEIRLTARLQHPHVLGLLDSGVFDQDAGTLAGRPYYVMPYVDGESLRDRLARQGALPLPDAVRVLREVADALSYAHDQGVVHCDIKPENILLTRGHAVVADFGIAKAIAAASSGDNGAESSTTIAHTQSGTLAGTPGYMAPEQAGVWTDVDHRADLYAWGVVAYESLTGHHPFGDRRSEAESPSGQTVEPLRPIRDVTPSVPPSLGALVMRCLAKATSQRPGSAAEIVAALDATPVGTQVQTPPFRVSHRTQRIALAALAILLVLMAEILFTMRARHMAAGRQTLVVGTGNPAVDVAAVQAAVDRGGTVVLEGTFSFRQPPTKPIAEILASEQHPRPPAAQVLVSKAVTISGVPDARGRVATIDGGTLPLYVDAPGAHVTIRGLRFVRPIRAAILLHAVHGMEISSNRIEGVEPFGGVSAAIGVNTSGDLPQPGNRATPEDVSGNLTIRLNDIDMTGGSTRESSLGIVVFSAGQSPRAEVTLDIVGNTIRNTTSSAINVRRVNGRVRVLGNSITTSSAVAPQGAEVVRLVNTGSYLMSDNTINCNWVSGVGIAVFSQFGEWPIQGAIIEGNRVNMLPPPGSVFGDSSAAIEIRGFATSNVVRYNIIRGQARTALAVDVFRGGVPADNAFIDNRVDDFHASLASVVVGSGALRTRLVRPGTILDHGEGTRIER